MVEKTRSVNNVKKVVSVFGTLGAGKSTFLNALLSEDLAHNHSKFKSSD